ncbi:hypothetical protein AVEN_147889-1 [Araneus ventricosus]|uniref:Dynein heavy chain tail domain-containing protein n=1 Tax=Araneus ventricosus TaxID=182803 RepID=A0A4Y2TX18_ARAVE|nr:hypothetical protein AVEN_147889-1 [Araneus ventricosus]
MGQNPVMEGELKLPPSLQPSRRRTSINVAAMLHPGRKSGILADLKLKAVICKSIPLLISEVQMVHAISRFYHTPEHMTSFFTKVTNQIVVVCKNYITESGKVDLWTLPRQVAIVGIRIINSYQLRDKRADAISHSGKCKQVDRNMMSSDERLIRFSFFTFQCAGWHREYVNRPERVNISAYSFSVNHLVLGYKDWCVCLFLP